MKLLFCVFLFVATASSTNITYENVTQANFTELQEREVAVPGLGHLFVMSRNFVDIVFRPFSQIEEFIFDLVSDTNGGFNSNFISELLAEWQTLASFEVGFMVCLVFGCLFVIFVPVVGLIMCCCRTCCSNCGGEMEQSVKRGKSNWRHCFCGTLFILTIFMAIPCIFVFLTNVWASQALEQIPNVAGSAITDLNNYISSLPVQLQHLVGEYSKLDTKIRDDIDNINTTLGMPIRDSFMDYTQPTLNELTALNNDTEEALSSLQSVKRATSALNEGISNLNDAMNATKTALDNDLSDAGTTCTGNPFCVAVQNSTVALNPTGADFSGLQSIDSQINNINNTLNQYDINQEVNTILDQINAIPQTVQDNSADATSKITDTLGEVNQTLNSALNNVSLDTVNELQDSLQGFGTTLDDTLSAYNANYDQYRYAAGAALASVIAVIVVLYWLGMISGTFSYSAFASERNSCSNCGGIMVMAAVGFSFIFSWLLMILVILTFTVGGHGERYLCQNLEPPYEGLKFADRVLSGTFTNIRLSIHSTVLECEANKAIYVAAGLENMFNISEALDNATSVIDGFRGDLAGLSVDLSNINTFPPGISAALESMKNSGLDGINFTAYLEQISKGLTSRGLIEYAQFLNDSAENMTIFNSSQDTQNLANLIRGHSYQIVLIQRDEVDPLSDSMDSLNRSVLRLEDISTGFTESIESLEVSLQQLNDSIQTNGSERVAMVTAEFANNIIDDVLGYSDYVLVQLNDHLGACRPIFVFYSKVTQVLCSYLIELLNGFWFSLGWCVFFLIPSAIFGMKLAKFYRRMRDDDNGTDAHWNDMEMDAVHHANNNNSKRPTSKLRFSPNEGKKSQVSKDSGADLPIVQSGFSHGEPRGAKPKSAQEPGLPSIAIRDERRTRSQMDDPNVRAITSKYKSQSKTITEERRREIADEKETASPVPITYVGVEPQPDMTYVGAEPQPDMTHVEAKPQPDMTYVGAKPQPDMTYVGAKPQPDMTHVEAKPQPDMTYVEAKPQPDMTYVEAKPQSDMTYVEAKPQSDMTYAEAKPQSDMTYVKTESSSDMTHVNAEVISNQETDSKPDMTYAEAESQQDMANIEAESQHDMANIEAESQSDMTYVKAESRLDVTQVDSDSQNNKANEEITTVTSGGEEDTYDDTDVMCRDAMSHDDEGTSQGSGEGRPGVSISRDVKSHQHLAQLDVGSRDTRRTVSEVKDAEEILKRWKRSSKIHPEGYY